MDFNLVMSCTIGAPEVLKAGMAGKRPELYQRMLEEIAEYAAFADQAGYAGFGHPEHHLPIEGFKVANEPRLWRLVQHTKRLRIITCGFVSTTLVNPHPHSVYLNYGRGVASDMRVREIEIAPRPLQHPHPPLYGGFTNSTRTAKFWARHKGKPIVLSGNYDFCASLWQAYREERSRHGHSVVPGEEAAWGGIMICAPTVEEEKAWAKDIMWFWEQWSDQFGQGLPMMLVGSPDTISREIEAASKRIPIKECFLLIPQGLHARDRIMTSLDLFASKVAPRFAA